MKKFIKHYAIHLFRNNKDDKDSDYRIIRQNRKFNKTRELLNDLKQKSQYYKRLISPEKGEELWQCSDIEYGVFTFFKAKRQEQFRPIILSLIHKMDLGEINKEQYEKAILSRYHFFICYTLIGEEKSNKLIDIVYKYSRMIENFTIEHMLNDSDSPDNAKIGNLIPLEQKLNERCKNSDWATKINIYKESNFKCARGIAEKYNNEIVDINARSEYLSKLVYNEIIKF